MREGRRRGIADAHQHAQSKKTKRPQKNGVAFANGGTMLRDTYIYNIIYNII